MAKKRSKSKPLPKTTVQRKVLTQNPFANHRLPVRNIRSLSQLVLDNAKYYQNDARKFSPLKKPMQKLARTTTGRIAQTSVTKNTPLKMLREQFSLPKTVTTCVRRSQRKEVLFAINRTGRGKTSRSPRRQTSSSRIKC